MGLSTTKNIIFILISLLAITGVYGQKSIDYGTQLMEQGDYKSALFTFDSFLENHPKKGKKVFASLALCYIGLNDNHRAHFYLQKAINLNPKQHRHHLKTLARLQNKVADPHLASASYATYLNHFPNDASAIKEWDWCQKIQLQGIDKTVVQPMYQLPLNGSLFVNDEVLFANTITIQKTSIAPNKLFAGIYKIDQKTSQFVPIDCTVAPFDNLIDIRCLQKIDTSILGDCFIADVLYNDKNQQEQRSLFLMYMKDNLWKMGNELSFAMNQNNTFKDPFFLTGENILFFSADYENNNGGFDLYSVTLKQNKWVNLTHLPSQINGSGDEVFPFVIDNDLYFSSNSNGGYGGFDFWKIQDITKRNQLPINLGTVYNSRFDDLNFVVQPQEQKAIFKRMDVSGRTIYSVYSKPFEAKTFREKQIVEQAFTMISLNEDETITDAKYSKKKEKVLHQKEQDNRLVLIGIVIDEMSSNPVQNAMVVLENLHRNSQQIFQTQTDGNFYFQLLYDEDYLLSYRMGSKVFDQKHISTRQIPEGTKILNAELNLYSEKEELTIDSYPALPTVIDTYSLPTSKIITDTFAFPKNNKSMYPDDMIDLNNEPYSSHIENEDAYFTIEKLFYKVQLGSYAKPLQNKHQFYAEITEYPLSEEQHESGRFRYLIGVFNDIEGSRKVMHQVRSKGFKDAYIVPYVDGNRVDIDVNKIEQYISEMEINN